ncbi:Cilia- and flagella-associated protein 43 [Chytriomyces hyalinus]|nr:Cilia- and flagella-associated protein 43 [Chytriomyces hyalinus]
MPATLFGELEISKSHGHTPVNTPQYIAPTVLCYVSGNTFNFADTRSGSKSKVKPIVADAQITAFGVYRKESLIAYAERGSTAVQLVKYPLGSSVGELSPGQDADIGIVSISISHDGKYLAALGDLPTFTITIWDWKNTSIVVSVENAGPARHISFNPFNSLNLCTSGQEGLVQFWKLEIGFKSNSLKNLVAMDAFLQDTKPIRNDNDSIFQHGNHAQSHLSPSNHAWQIDAQVLATCETGDAVVQFNPITGDAKVLFSAWMSGYEIDQRKRAREDADENEDAVSMNDANDFVKEEYGGSENFQCLLATKNEIALAGKDGVLRFLDYDGNLKSQTTISEDAIAITMLAFSPDFSEISIVAKNGSIFIFHMQTASVSKLVKIESANIVSLALFPVSDVLVTAHVEPSIIKFWDPESKAITNTFPIGGVISAIAVHGLSTVIAVGSDTGVVRIYDATFAKSSDVRLLVRCRASKTAIKTMLFDPSGRFLLVLGQHEDCVTIFDIIKRFEIVGRIHLPSTVVTAFWDLEEMEDTDSEEYSLKSNLALFLMTHSPGKSDIYRYSVPLEGDIASNPMDANSLQKFMPLVAKYRIDDTLSDFLVVSSGVSNARTIYAISEDKKLKNYPCPANTSEETNEFTYLSAPLLELSDHEKSGNKLLLSLSSEWLFSYSPDGTITARNFLDPEKSTKLFVHDSLIGGVKNVAIARDAHEIFCVGNDGVLKELEWKPHNAAARRALIEAREAAETALTSKMDAMSRIMQLLDAMSTCENNEPDRPDEPSFFDSGKTDGVHKPGSSSGEASTQSEYEERIKSIRERLLKAMQRNETLPELEKLPKTDFIIDFAERDRLLAAADERVSQVRKEIELENLKKRVIRNRIKDECWDSMEVIGASIKSFHPDPTTKKIVEVTNFPIKKKTPQQIQKIERVRLLRKIHINYTLGAEKKSSAQAVVAPIDENALIESPLTTDLPPPPPIEENTYQDFKSLLYSDLELTTDERKRIQIILLDEAINEIKVEFNTKFKDFFKVKKDEIMKIDDKNDRIATIMAELQTQEALFKPVLDDDEVPERIIEVNVSEVHAEKFIGPEELRRIEAQKREEEERRRAAQEDNYRERGLMIMMGGKLDDRSEETEKEELIRPDWMNKPREEMNEEERKQVKEFEKKVATMKEEQEKYKKALETELKKLQGFILELCDGFDQRLKELLVKKLEADKSIYKNELKRIKLQQAILLGEGDEAKESRLNQRLEELRIEKNACMQYMPEIKKELERRKDEYEITSKRDKEMEKLFKKEFTNPSNPDQFEGLYRLFKERQSLKPTNQDNSQNHNESPFPGIEVLASTDTEEQYAPLSFERDSFEGVSQETWIKLIDFRDRKIASEADLKASHREYAEIQALASCVNEDADKIRKETERVMSDLAAFAEYRFHTTYNPEALFELKQGQVEVPQAPVVTDYSDAELIHRGVVEKLNDNIISLGNMKVDALKEMKEYRKGIHALEWENKMLDFQAEDLVIRTRDIQLLRVTKQMQEYIRGGDEMKQSNEISALERRADFNSKSHVHKLDDKSTLVDKFEKKIAEKKRENDKLEMRLRDLEAAVKERRKIHDVQVKRKTMAGAGGGANGVGDKNTLSDIYTRRKLVDLAKSQSQDIAILREEVERLRLRTYPAFPSKSTRLGI